MVKIAFAGLATVALSAVGANVMVPNTLTASMDVLPLATIDPSSDTIGFADSDLYGMTPAQIDQQLDEMQALGVNDVRIEIPWAGVEPLNGYYDWSTVDAMVDAANARGMGVLGVLNDTPSWAVTPGTPELSGRPEDPAAYGAFAGMVAQRYAGKVSAYEIWNEPNGAEFYAPQPDPAGYTDLLKAAYPAIKAADPNATVIGGVLGAVVDYGNLTMNPVTFVQDIYADGGGAYFDALSYHPYQYTTEFSQGAPLPDSPLNQLTAIRSLMVANGDSSKLIWASEYGEPTSVGGDAQQAAYLQDMLTTWRTLGYTGPAFVWTLQDRDTGSTDAEDTFGVIRSDGTLKPAAYVIEDLATSPSATPEMARMALASPEAQQATPAAVAALTKLAAEPDTTAPVAQAPQTPVAAVVQVAANTLAAAGQFAATALNQVNAMVLAAVTPTPAATTSAASTSPAAIPTVGTAQLRSLATATAAAPPAAATPAAVTPAAVTPATAPAADPPQGSDDSHPSKRSAGSPKRSAGKHARSSDDQQQPQHPK